MASVEERIRELRERANRRDGLGNPLGAALPSADLAALLDVAEAAAAVAVTLDGVTLRLGQFAAVALLEEALARFAGEPEA